MKRYCLIAVLILLAYSVISCTSESKEVTPLKVNSNVLSGTWEMRGLTGGMVPYNPNSYKPGNGNIWKFTADHFERIYNDSVYDSGSYRVTNTGVDLNTNRTINQFIFNDTPAESFELKNDTLHIYNGMIAADGTISRYVKIADASQETQ